jgi:hypothetical protein
MDYEVQYISLNIQNVHIDRWDRLARGGVTSTASHLPSKWRTGRKLRRVAGAEGPRSDMASPSEKLAGRLVWLTILGLAALILWKMAASVMTFGDCPEPPTGARCWANKDAVSSMDKYVLVLVLAAYVAGVVLIVWRKGGRRSPDDGSQTPGGA